MEKLTEREQALVNENLLLKEHVKCLPHVHIVQPGDTVYGIIKQYKGSAEEMDLLKMIKLNIKLVINPNIIHPGDQLRIPREWICETPVTDEIAEQLKKEENNLS